MRLIFLLYSGDVTTDIDHLHVKKFINKILLYGYRG
jgi:hypothetical protein